MMTTDEWDKMWDQIWDRISEELKLLSSYIQEIFESFEKTTQNFGDITVNEKPVQKSFKQPCKKNHIYKNSTPIFRVEKKNPKHLPYQRRYY